MAINIPLFTPASNDQSLYYLGQVFGRMGNILTPTKAPAILGQMFGTFNTIVLTIGVLIVLYVTIVGVIKTAHEGEALGKQWSTLWLPLRMVMGIAALIPSASGYSFLQIMIMWVIVQGIGAADAIWTTTLKYYDAFGSLTAPVNTVGVNTTNTMQTLFQLMVCQESSNFTTITDENKTAFTSRGGDGGYCADTTTVSCGGTEKNGVIQVGPQGVCGVLYYCDPATACLDNTSASGQIRCAACNAQKEALFKILGKEATSADVYGETKQIIGFGQVALTLVRLDYEFRKFYLSPGGKDTSPWISNFCSTNNIAPGNCCGTPTDSQTICAFDARGLTTDFITVNNVFPETLKTVYWPEMQNQISGLTTNFVKDAADYYNYTINQAVQAKITEISTSTNDSARQAINDARDGGWLYAGAFYYVLSKGNNSNQSSATPMFTAIGNDPAIKYLTGTKQLIYSFRYNYAAAGQLITYLNQQAASSGASGNTSFTQTSSSFPDELSGLSGFTSGLNDLASSCLETFQSNFTGSSGKVTNPLVSIQTYGYYMLIAIQVVFAALLTLLALLGLLGYVGGSVLGTTVVNPVGPTITLLSIVFTPLLSALLGGLFLFAAILAIYTPMIPFIIFTIGVLAWFILVIEAIIAGPLVALGLLMPGGQQEIFGKAEHALMLLFSIFLRPGLMIFGMVAAILLSIVAVSIINVAFGTVAGAVLKDPGIVEILLFIAAYAAFILAALNKCFTLIHVVPDQVLRWIGHHAEQSGAPGEALGHIEKGVGGMAGGAKQAGGQAVGGAAAGGSKAAEVYKKRKQEGKPGVGAADDTEK